MNGDPAPFLVAGYAYSDICGTQTGHGLSRPFQLFHSSATCSCVQCDRLSCGVIVTVARPHWWTTPTPPRVSIKNAGSPQRVQASSFLVIFHLDHSNAGFIEHLP